MPAHPIPRPAADEHDPYYARYIERVPGDDARPALAAQVGGTVGLLAPLDETAALHRYAPGKWSIKQVMGHLCDGERVFSYRAMRIARGDTTPLASFDENDYAAAGGFDARPLPSLLAEWSALRAATLALFDGLDPAALARRGTAAGATITPRALAWILAGHELHHVAILRERYGVGR